MKIKIFCSLLLVFSIFIAKASPALVNLDKAEFYSILKSGKISDINRELELLKTAEISEKEAYEGALLMRKAGLMAIPIDKLKLFKKGRIKLETAILNDSTNGEYRFLRLIIEEHAPKMVKYSADIESDKIHIKKSFKNLAPAVRDAIMDYSKNSKILSPQDF